MSLIACNILIHDQVLTKKVKAGIAGQYLHPNHGVDILTEVKHSVNTLLAEVREVRKEPA